MEVAATKWRASTIAFTRPRPQPCAGSWRRAADAEDYAQRHIASYTDAGDRWTPHDAIECYLRDCIFNRGAGGAASIYQMALGVRVDGDVGPITMDAGEQARAAALLPQIRAARERYEREVVGRDERSRFWRGLVNRWNNALVFAEEFLDFGGDLVEPAETREIPGDGETSGEEREERPGNEESAMTEEAMAVRESTREEAGDAQEAPAEDVSRSRTRGPADPASAAGMNVRVIPRPLSTRKRGAQPTLVVLHATAGASAISSINHLRSVGLSYHFIIARDGRDSARTRDADASTPIIFQCVDPAHRAAHVRSTIPRLRVMGASTNVRSASAWRISRAAASATRRGRSRHLINCSRTSVARIRRSCT